MYNAKDMNIPILTIFKTLDDSIKLVFKLII